MLFQIPRRGTNSLTGNVRTMQLCTSSVHLLCFRRRRKHGCDLDELPHYLAHHLPLRFLPDRASSLGPRWSLYGGVHGLGFGMMMAPLNCVQRDIRISFVSSRAGFRIARHVDGRDGRAWSMGWRRSGIRWFSPSPWSGTVWKGNG